MSRRLPAPLDHLVRIPAIRFEYNRSGARSGFGRYTAAFAPGNLRGIEETEFNYKTFRVLHVDRLGVIYTPLRVEDLPNYLK